MHALKASLVLVGAVAGQAFVSPRAGLRVKCSRGVFLETFRSRPFGADRRDRDSGEEPWGLEGHIELAVKNMLSEAAVASMVYYWLEFRDDLKPQWMKQFTRHNGDIQDIGWKQHLGQMMRAEPEEMTVRKLAQRPRGGSGNNPFLEANRSAMEYIVLIEPQNIAKNVMQIREQISLEWAQDLDLVAAENSELARHRADTRFLDVETAEKRRKLVFDHDPLNNTSSPYRGKNYKLLLELITTAAVRAYRSELRISGDRYTLNWLEKFLHRNDMEDKLTLKGNELVESIMDGPIVVIKDPRKEKTRIIDPSYIGRQIMGFRQLEAQLVIKALDSVSDDHAMLTRQFLEERLRDQMEDIVLKQRRKRIVEASAPSDQFPNVEGADEQGWFEE